MPDLLDDLRRYGDAVESAAIDRQPPDYLAVAAPTPRRPRRLALAGVAVALAALAVAVAVARDDQSNDVRVDTPPTPVETQIDTPVSPTSLPTEQLPPLTAATEIAASDASWEPRDPGPLAQRWWPAVVWTGDRMIVWGGAGDATGDAAPELDDGASYDPAADMWTPLPSAPVSARAMPVVAWTGMEMLIWGGGGGNTDWTARADGAAYDPEGQTWRMLPPAPLPAGPLYSGAWTGAELVVVGESADGLLSASYDPVADSWRRLATVAIGSPSPGSLLDVSWAGSRVVVLASLPLGDPTEVVVYDPATEEWSSSSPQGFGSRSVSTAVLHEKVHIASYSQDTDGTAAFDPATGTWTGPVSISVDLSCEGGSRLVAMADDLFATGCGRSGIYDPKSATWQPVASPQVGEPQSAIWTGSELLWWGAGYSESSPLGLWALRP